ncbi:MAG: helix-turn-helix transcriptional regulator [Candidatus Nomurabacteria bacterium]|jgi:transcriptional regulator with XRE-family HTH domain|nr:helix-turn-helix transcriptional regulator [Candidatus Nomurabacteria bacterium]
MLGKNIGRLRTRLGLTQEQLAEKMGVTRSSIARWENDIDIPKMANLIELAKIFGVSVNELTNVNIDIKTGRTDESPKQREYHRFRKTFARGIAFATSIILLGLASMMFCINESPLIKTKYEIVAQCEAEHSGQKEIGECTTSKLAKAEYDDTAVLMGTAVLFVSVILAVPFYIILGIQYGTIRKGTNQEDRLVPAELKTKINRDFPLQIAVGVCLVLVGIVSLIMAYGLKMVPMYSTLPVMGLFIVLSLAIYLFIYGGIQKSSIAEAEVAEKLAKLTGEQKRKTDLVGKLCAITMLTATAVYVGSGLFFATWGWMWPVFPIGGIVCAIISVFFDPLEEA